MRDWASGRRVRSARRTEQPRERRSEAKEKFMPVRVNPYPRWGSSRFGRDLSFWYNDYIPEPAPVTIAVLPLTLYGAEREAEVLRFGCFAVAAMIMYMSTCTSSESFKLIKWCKAPK
jgi:hypothetical protein